MPQLFYGRLAEIKTSNTQVCPRLALQTGTIFPDNTQLVTVRKPPCVFLNRPGDIAQLPSFCTLFQARRPAQREGKRPQCVVPGKRAASSLPYGGRIWSLISPCGLQQYAKRSAVVLYWREGRVIAALQGLQKTCTVGGFRY